MLADDDEDFLVSLRELIIASKPGTSQAIDELLSRKQLRRATPAIRLLSS